MDAGNRLFFRDHLTTEADLKLQLREAVKKTPDLTLVVQADGSVTHENLVRLDLLARDAGIREALHAVRPRLVAPAAKP